MLDIVTPEMIDNYFDNMVNRYFKILPMFENETESLSTYLDSFRCELCSVYYVVDGIENDSMFVTLICILTYFIDNIEKELDKESVKREVFRAISICNQLKARYGVSAEV